MLPSCCSPSPMMQKTVWPSLSSLPAIPMPTAMLRPWPSEPLETSTPGSFKPVRMSLEWRIEFAQGNDVFDGKIAGESEAEIQRGSFVSARPDDAVASGPVGIVGIVFGDFEVQRRDDLHHGERASGVAGAGGAQRHQVVAAHQPGGLLKFFEGKLADHSFGERIDDRHGRILCGGWEGMARALLPGVKRTLDHGQALRRTISPLRYVGPR